MTKKPIKDAVDDEWSKLLKEIRSCLPYGNNPDAISDMVADIALLVCEGRIERSNLRSGILQFLPQIKKKYRYGADLSLEQPIGEGLTLKDVVLRPASQKAHRCPTCRRKCSASATYCSPTCALVYYQRTHKKVNPSEVKELSQTRWLSRNEIAKVLGVTRHAINNVVSRHKLSRFLPSQCRIRGCQDPPVRFRNSKGQMVGNMCQSHRREKSREYMRKHRQGQPCTTPQDRKMQASKASHARWEKALLASIAWG